MKNTHKANVTISKSYLVDLPSILKKYAKELEEDEIDFDDEEAIVQAVWDGEGGNPGEFFQEESFEDVEFGVTKLK